MTQNKKTLAQYYRAQRRLLSDSQQQAAALAISQRIIHSPWFNSSKHIACYMASQHEMNSRQIIEYIWQHNKLCYLPILHPVKTRQMQFARYQRHTPLKNNRFNIAEPIGHEITFISPQHLDLVLVPLVAFDEQGNRLGMGAGYYDQYFAFRQKTQPPPLLVGLAHECQKASQLPSDPWDIKLDYIITDQQQYTIKRSQHHDIE